MGEMEPVTSVRPTVPESVSAAIERAMERVPADRFADGRELRAALADPNFRHAPLGHAVRSAGPAAAYRNRLSLALAVVSVLLAVGWVGTWAARPDPPRDVVRFAVPVGESEAMRFGALAPIGRPWARSITLSPAGDELAFLARGPESPVGQIYLRALDQQDAVGLSGTEGAVMAEFSPDGRSIVFVGRDSLVRRVLLDDGRVETVTLFDVDERVSGMATADDGSIIFTTHSALHRVPAAGGDLSEILRSSPPEGVREWFGAPHVLPGSRTILMHILRPPEMAAAEIVAVDVASGEIRTVLRDAVDPHVVSGGYLAFMRQGTLLAVRFDPDRLEVLGEPARMVEGVMQSLRMPNTTMESGMAQVAVSSAGHLAYVEGGMFPRLRGRVVRVSPDGDTTDVGIEPGAYDRPRLSPDGGSLALGRGTGLAREVVVYDLERGQSRPLSIGGVNEDTPIWSPDGQRIAFASDRDVPERNVYVQSVDGSGTPLRLAPSPTNQLPSSWASSGEIAYVEDGDIWVTTVGGTPRRFITSPGSAAYPEFSPDGTWLAYRDARGALYVRPYPAGEPTVLIADEGSEPAWTRDGRRIVYTAENAYYEVDVEPDGSTLRPGRPRFLMDVAFRSNPIRGWDLAPDGSIVMVAGRLDWLVRTPNADEIVWVRNWVEEVRERLSGG